MKDERFKCVNLYIPYFNLIKMVYPILKKILGAPVKKFWIYDLSGLANLPKTESFILASNHVTMMDGLVLLCIVVPYIDKRMHFYVKSVYFKNVILRFFLGLGGCIPVYVGKRKNIKLNKITHYKALSYLKKGESIGIFPEGKISLDGNLGEPKKGLGRLAIESNVKIVPVGVSVRGKIVGSKKISAKLKGYIIRIGKPLEFEKFANINKEKRIKCVCDETMKKIAELIK